MITLYRLGLLFSIFIFLAAVKCSPVNNESAPVQESAAFDEKHQSDFAKDTADVLGYLSLAHSQLYLDAEKAIVNAKLVLKLSQKHQWNKGKILAYNLLSTFYLMDGSYDVLRELSNETLLLSRKVKMPIYNAHARRFMAESYSEYRQWDSAQVNYERALKVFVEMKDDSSRALCLENMGNMWRERDKIDIATAHYEQAYNIFKGLHMESNMGSVLESWGYMYVRLNQHEIAEKYLLDALTLSQKSKNLFGEISVLNNLGNSYYWEKKYDKAIDACQKALKYSRQYHTTQQTNWAHQTLGRAYKEKNMLEEAMYYNENAYIARRKIHDDYIQRQYTMYQLMFENQQMDSAIQKRTIEQQEQVQRFLIGLTCLIIAFAAFLWYNNKKLRRKNAEIQEAMAQGQALERKRVAAELHDHLGGTLASLNWYLFGIDKKALPDNDQKIYNRVHEMVNAAYKEVRSLSHNLLPAELEEQGLTVALARLTSKLNDNKSIAFTFDNNVDQKRYGTKTEFELYSIVLELANNIIKHSKASIANISLNEVSKTIHLIVTDNGTGFDKSAKSGMGLFNIKNRVESLSGKIKINENFDSGTRIEIEIPITNR
ncbi:two-component sensor histidine kinase [Dyadobacter luteus]|uniref:histidine kinase n=1 Tax=Dyadobacter luteus TaxID=2259619 RepID=A0A3D8Y8S8_9BACT|nr:tetratricopeptide repeat protein [Dyadobacter luteus]REA59734.1 two-component sensor histidine kinase [Dyadobacter luteus]